jgi:hypothetical protein
MSVDSAEFHNLLEKSNILDLDLPSYKSWDMNTYLADTNNGSYSNGLISFNTMSVSDKHVVLAESVVSLPLQVTNAAWTADSKLALKNSLLSLIYGVRVTSTSGAAILDEMTGSLPIINNLRLLVEEDLDFVASKGDELMFKGPDRLISNNVNPGAPVNVDTSTVIGVFPKVAIGPATNDTLFNPALADRVSLFTITATDVSATVKTFIANIKLKYLHPFFAACDFPLSNYPLMIQFQLASIGAGANYMPFECPRTSLFPSNPIGIGSVIQPTFAANVGTTIVPAAIPAAYYAGMPCVLSPGVIGTSVAPAGTAYGTQYYYIPIDATTFSLATSVANAVAAAPVVVAITGAGTSTHRLSPNDPGTAVVAVTATPTLTVSTNVSDRGVSLSSCRIYFKSVQFRDDQAEIIASKLKAGFTKTLTFKMTDLPGIADQTNSALASRNTVLTYGVTRPVAVWVLLVPTGTVAAVNNSFPGSMGSNGLNHLMYNANLLINGSNFFPNTLSMQDEFYSLIKRRMPEMGGLISYNDWLCGVNPYYFDISSNPVTESGKSTQIALTCSIGQGQIASNTAPKTAFAANVTNNNYDLICLIERLTTVILKISASSITTETFVGVPN